MSASDEKEPLITNVISPDLAVVKAYILDMVKRGAIAKLVDAIIALLIRMRDLNTELVRRLANTSRKKPPNESLRRLQLELPLLMAPAVNDGATGAPTGEKPKAKKRGPKQPTAHGRTNLPDHLPRVPDVHHVCPADRTCPTCEVEAETIGFKTVEKLDVEPAKYIVRADKYETVACQTCHEYVRSAPRPDEVVDRGILGNELLVQALVDHYDEATPWERMERTARTQGVPLSANTLAASVGKLIDLFDPIVGHIKEACFSARYTALDATAMPVLDPLHPLGIRNGSLWAIEGGHRYAYFFFAPTGHADHIDDLLAGRTLASVMCDGSATNNCVERAGGTRGGCNAHARRGLIQALRLGDARAVEGIDLFAQLFHVDAEGKRCKDTLEQRCERRKIHSTPIVEKLHAWVEDRRGVVEPKSKLGKALGYIHRQWPRLTRFLDDPLMDLTNNEVERDLRRWVLDRKTWYFVGHDASARRAADALTILTTCRKMGIEPRRYLRETLAKILAGEKSLVALLPETHADMLEAERLAASAPSAAAA